MSSQKQIQDELRSLGSVLPANNSQPFSVPEGYFEGLAATILAKIKESASPVQAELDELSPLLAGISKQTPYSVPSFYFEKNTEAINAFVKPDPVFLAGISKEVPYTVPEGYFQALPAQILNRLERPKTRVVPLFARTWMRVASAAAVAGALFFGGYQLLSTNNDSVEPIVAQQRVDSTNNLVARNEQPLIREIKQVSTKELEEFIENVQVNAAKVPSVKESKDTDKAEVEELLKDVSVSEMENFLSAIPTADDELLITD